MSKTQDEQIVIGSLLRGNHIDTIDLFDADDFVVYRPVFQALKKHHKEQLDMGIVAIARESGVEIGMIAELMGVSEIDFAGCGRNLKRLRIERIAKNGEMFTPLSDKAIEQERKLADALDGVMLVKKDLATAYLEELDARSTRKPVFTGLKRLDYMLGGLRQGELTTVAARPAMGKSAFCLQVAENASKQGKKVVFFALEMSEFELLDRLAVRGSDISSHKLRQGSANFTDRESEEFVMLLDHTIKNFTDNVIIDTTIANVDMYAGIIANEKPDIVIVDQLSCLRSSQLHKSIRERFCYCTTLLKRISVEYNIPILLAAQISRSGDNRKPTLSDLKESGSIEEDSDNCILLSSTSEIDAPQKEVLCELAKHRQGTVGGMELIFVPNKIKFYEQA